MKDQPNNWEADWREELAGYEAPLQPGDWAGMESLLDGGGLAPPDGQVMSAAKASTVTVAIKSVILTLLVVAVAGVGFWLLTDGKAAETAAQLSPETTQNSVAVLDSLPPGYRYDIKTYRQLDRTGKVLSVRYDTSIVPVQMKYDTVFLTDAEGNLQLRIDTAIVPTRSVLARPMSLIRQRPGGGTSLSEAPALPAEVIGTDLITSPAPVAAAPANPNRDAKAPGTRSGSRSTSYELTPKPPRERPVPRLRLRLIPDMSSYDAYYQFRLRQIVEDHPVKVIPAKSFNGYFPAYRNDFN